jgi:hypothetical protein
VPRPLLEYAVTGKVDYSGCHEKELGRMDSGLYFVVTLAVIVYEYAQAIVAFRSGQSPLAVIQATQQRFFHVMANPWFFSAYLVLLVALLFPVIRQISTKAGSTNDF